MTTAAPKKTTSSFAPQGQQRNLTRERIAEDMKAFDKAGGKIEVLGNTPLRGRLDAPAAAATKPTAAGTPGKA